MPIGASQASGLHSAHSSRVVVSAAEVALCWHSKKADARLPAFRCSALL